jgi:hypothetical protein
MAHGIIKDIRASRDGLVSDPYKEFMYLRCGEAITKGNVVRWAVAGEGTAPYSITVLSTDTTRATHKLYGGVLIMQGDAARIPVGFAQETGAAGDVIKVQTRGRGEVNIVTGGSMATSTYLTAGASGTTAEVTLGSTSDADDVLICCGIGLDANASTVGYADTYIVLTLGGW